jgi:hypothetical protein
MALSEGHNPALRADDRSDVDVSSATLLTPEDDGESI